MLTLPVKHLRLAAIANYHLVGGQLCFTRLSFHGCDNARNGEQQSIKNIILGSVPFRENKVRIRSVVLTKNFTNVCMPAASLASSVFKGLVFLCVFHNNIHYYASAALIGNNTICTK